MALMTGGLYLFDRLNNATPAPQNISRPQSLEPLSVILSGKWDFATVIKLSFLRGRDYPE